MGDLLLDPEAGYLGRFSENSTSAICINKTATESTRYVDFMFLGAKVLQKPYLKMSWLSE